MAALRRILVLRSRPYRDLSPLRADMWLKPSTFNRTSPDFLRLLSRMAQPGAKLPCSVSPDRATSVDGS